MAKKKPARAASKGPSEAAAAAAEAPAEQQVQEPTAEPAAEEAPGTPPQQEASELPSSVPELQDMVRQLSSELADTKQQLQRLQADMATSRTTGKDATSKSDAFKHQDVQKLQERLAQLRKEQAEADAARDAAWKQLKSVVNSISKLASPDYLASINIPS
jgi:predicted  nucleic acid-binding Zn-ribbon protein